MAPWATSRAVWWSTATAGTSCRSIANASDVETQRLLLGDRKKLRQAHTGDPLGHQRRRALRAARRDW